MYISMFIYYIYVYILYLFYNCIYIYIYIYIYHFCHYTTDTIRAGSSGAPPPRQRGGAPELSDMYVASCWRQRVSDNLPVATCK